MARKEIGSVWDRTNRNAINDNFEELYGYKNTADSAKEAADYAVNTAEFAKAKAESVQAQFNQVVIAGDSSVEAAQARVSADGTSYTTLKERLDSEHGQLSAQLAQTKKLVNVATFPSIQDAIDHAITLKSYGHLPTLYFKDGHVFKTDVTIHIPANINVEMDSSLIYTGISDEPILVIGSTGENTYRSQYKISVIRDSLSTWDNEDNIGVVFRNIYESVFDIVRADNNTIGVQLLGDGSGVAYNNIYLRGIMNNKIGLDLNNINGGWVNENKFYNGRFWCKSDTHTTKSRYGVRITSKDGLYKNNNNNNFVKPSFELRVPTSGESLPVLIEHGMLNSFTECRNESNGTTFARFENEATENVVELGYGLVRIEDNSRYPTNVGKTRRDLNLREYTTLIYESGNLKERAIITEDGLQFHGLFATSSGGNVGPTLTNSSLLENCVSLNTTRALSIRMKTDYVKKFCVKTSSFNRKPRVGIRCYDKNMSALYSEDHPYVLGNIRRTIYANAQFGGIYWTSETDRPTYVSLADDVAYVDVLIIGGDIGSFAIYTNFLMTTPFNPFEEDIPLTLQNVSNKLDGMITSGYASSNRTFSLQQGNIYLITCSTGGTTSSTLGMYLLHTYSESNFYLHTITENSGVNVTATSGSITFERNGGYYYSIVKLVN